MKLWKRNGRYWKGISVKEMPWEEEWKIQRGNEDRVRSTGGGGSLWDAVRRRMGDLMRG